MLYKDPLPTGVVTVEQFDAQCASSDWRIGLVCSLPSAALPTRPRGEVTSLGSCKFGLAHGALWRCQIRFIGLDANFSAQGSFDHHHPGGATNENDSIRAHGALSCSKLRQ